MNRLFEPHGHGSFRPSFSNLLISNGEDVKTVQFLMRHANSRLSLDIYSRGVDRGKERAQSRVADIIPKEMAVYRDIHSRFS